MSAIDGRDFTAYSLMLDGPAGTRVRMFGTSVNGATDTQTFTLDANEGFETFPVAAKPAFAAMTSFELADWSRPAATTFLLFSSTMWCSRRPAWPGRSPPIQSMFRRR